MGPPLQRAGLAAVNSGVSTTVERPTATRSSAATSRRTVTARHQALALQHALWWSRGEYGKGILYASGRLQTWPEAEGDHRAYADEYCGRTGDRPRMFFLIRPDGKASIPLRHAYHADELAAALRAADPRLTPFSLHPVVSPSTRCQAMHAVAQFIAGPG